MTKHGEKKPTSMIDKTKTTIKTRATKNADALKQAQAVLGINASTSKKKK